MGAIDKRYDVAISTACSGLDHIVVKRYEDAQSAVDFLKQNKIGRASFIPVERMEEQWRNALNQRFEAPHHSLRLFDLITIKNPEFRCAFYSQMRNTLVTTDIDSATSIAYGSVRHRVVTEDGKLIEIAGTMSGGGKVKRGGMGQSIKGDFNSEEVEQLKHKQKFLAQTLDGFRQQL